MEDIVIVAAARTAVGKFGGTLGKTPATLVGATPWVRPPVHAGFVLNTAAMRAALARAPTENLAAPARFTAANTGDASVARLAF